MNEKWTQVSGDKNVFNEGGIFIDGISRIRVFFSLTQSQDLGIVEYLMGQNEYVDGVDKIFSDWCTYNDFEFDEEGWCKPSDVASYVGMTVEQLLAEPQYMQLIHAAMHYGWQNFGVGEYAHQMATYTESDVEMWVTAVTGE